MVLSTSFHWCRQSIHKFEYIIGIVNGQTKIFLKGLEKGVHGDVIIEDGIKIWRNSRFHKCIIFWGLVTHIAYLLLFGDVKAIKMIVLWSAISAALIHAQIGVTERRTRARDKQLVVATMVVAIMVVHIVVPFFNIAVVVVRACLILWVLMALVVGMLAVDAMQMAWLVELTVLGRGLAITTRVLVAGAMSFKAAMIAITGGSAVASRPAIALVMPHMAIVALLAF
jgi:hypothetical protein